MVKPAFTFRRASAEDCVTLNAITQSSSAYAGPYRAILDGYEIGQDQVRTDEVHVAERGGRLVGHVCTTRGFDFQEGRPALWIADLYVEPNYRRRGIARSLVSSAVARESPWKPSLVQWMIAPNNASARDFYLSLGAHYDSGQPMYLGPKEIAALGPVNG